MIRFYQVLLMLSLLSMAACTSATPIASPPAEAAPTETTAAQQEPFTMRVLPTELEQPWEIALGPDGYLWITERIGKQVTRVNPTDGSSHVAVTIAEVYQNARQDGLLGMAFHPDLLQDKGNDYVYLAYTYDAAAGAAVDRRAKISRYTYDANSQILADPVDLISNLPGSTDHNSGRLVFGVDQKLYYSIGEQGNNQFGNFCQPILAQVLPTAAEVSASDWSHYPGKVLRLNLDGSIPADNPTLEGVQSHIYSYGHRNVQGLVAGVDGQLYAAEHGPKSDDEINRIEAGKNYGWPQVAGFQDDQAYVYANWSAAPNCEDLEYSDYAIPASVPQQLESEWSHPDFMPPLKTFYTVAKDYNFQNPECADNNFICWPTIAPSGLDIYMAQADGIPGWPPSLLIPALKTGTVYRVALSADGTTLDGEAIPYFKTTNRYRDLAISLDGRTFYIITDNDNYTQDPNGLPTEALENPGAILEFTYMGSE